MLSLVFYKDCFNTTQSFFSYTMNIDMHTWSKRTYLTTYSVIKGRTNYRFLPYTYIYIYIYIHTQFYDFSGYIKVCVYGQFTKCVCMCICLVKTGIYIHLYLQINHRNIFIHIQCSKHLYLQLANLFLFSMIAVTIMTESSKHQIIFALFKFVVVILPFFPPTLFFPFFFFSHHFPKLHFMSGIFFFWHYNKKQFKCCKIYRSNISSITFTILL